MQTIIGASQGIIPDSSDYASMSQDSGQTAAVTAASQPVGYWRDLSGKGNHFRQTDNAKRPTTGRRPTVGVRNLANGSASADLTAPWRAYGTFAGITATKIASGLNASGLPFVRYAVSGTATSNSAVTLHTFSAFVVPIVSGQAYTISAAARIIAGAPNTGSGGFRLELIGINSVGGSTGNSGFSPRLTSTTDVVMSVSATMSNVATVAARAAVAATFAAGEVLNYTVEIAGFQLEQGPARTAYQHNYSATNVTEAGFPDRRFVAGNGVNQFMQSAANVDFSGSDEITVVAGLRKVSDAARQVVICSETDGARRCCNRGTFLSIE
ncbi:MAG: hypothetical protein U5N55_01470 [Cypionkella sp.]|nr:hypothetical protein [Cypionkella sp.]